MPESRIRAAALAFVSFATCVVAQAPALSPEAPAPEDLRGEIQVGGARAFAIGFAGDLWIGSQDGRLYVSRDWNQTWSEVPTPARPPGEFGLGGDGFTHVRFFDAQRGFVAGWIGGDVHDEIFRTQDGGRSWEVVRIPSDLWVCDAQVTSDGHAWLVGSTGELLASDDYGATWTVAGAPFDRLYRSYSVCFVVPEFGVVGASFNGLKLTRDGGRTWTRLDSPADVIGPEEVKWTTREGSTMVADEDGRMSFRPLPPGPHDAIDRVWILGESLCVLQADTLFERSLKPDGQWRVVRIEGRKVVAAERSPAGLVVVDEERKVHLLSEALERIGGAREAISDVPSAIAAASRGVAFLTNRRGNVCVLAGEELVCSPMYAAESSATWPIGSFDRSSDGALLGVSRTALYRSVDSGRTWARLLEHPECETVSCSADGTSAVVVASGMLWRWSAGSATLDPIALELRDPHELRMAARRGPLWVATAFETDGSERTNEMLHTSDTVFVGPGFTAHAFASPDEGRTWRRADRCEGATLHALWLGADDVLSLCMSDGSLRRGRLDPSSSASWAAELTETPLSGHGLGGQSASWLAFPDEREGWAGGHGFFDGAVLRRSTDAGRTWAPIEEQADEWLQVFLVGGRTCVRLVNPLHGPTRIEAWRSGGFAEVTRSDVAAWDARVDATGRLLVRRLDGEVWSSSADGKDWEKLGTIPLPAR